MRLTCPRMKKKVREKKMKIKFLSFKEYFLKMNFN